MGIVYSFTSANKTYIKYSKKSREIMLLFVTNSNAVLLLHLKLFREKKLLDAHSSFFFQKMTKNKPNIKKGREKKDADETHSLSGLSVPTVKTLLKQFLSYKEVAKLFIKVFK